MYEDKTPNEEGQEDDGLGAGSIFGIVLACIVTALLILILIIAAILAVHRDRKKHRGKAELKPTSPDSLNGYAVCMQNRIESRLHMLTQMTLLTHWLELVI